MKSTLALAASEIIQDVKGKISVINIIEGVTAVSYPLVMPQLHFLSVLIREESDPETIEIDFFLTLDNEEILNGKKQTINFQGNLRTRFIIELSSFVIPKAGALSFKILHQENCLSSYEMLFVSTKASETLQGKGKEN